MKSVVNYFTAKITINNPIARSRLVLIALLLVSLFSAPLNAEVNRQTLIAKINGIEIAYQDLGNPSDPAVVLVMGLGRQLTAWNETFVNGLLAKRLRVILFDNRDVGLSSHLDDLGEPNIPWQAVKFFMGREVQAPYLLQDMANDTLALMDHLKIQQFHIAGTSLGGMIAQEVAFAAPQRIRSLIPIMTTSGEKNLPKPSLDIVYLMLSAPTAAAEKKEAVAHQYRLLTKIGSPVFPYVEAELQEYLDGAHDRAHYPVGRKRQLLAVWASGDRKESLTTLNVPTLVIHGSDDRLIPPAHGERLAELVPGAELSVINGMGHGLEPEVSEQVVAKMVQFILELEGKTASLNPNHSQPLSSI